MNKTCDDIACNDEGVPRIFAGHPFIFAQTRAKEIYR